ncbi:purine permease 3-like [Punica granatum]|uniref:Purine permease 3-like n=2 Tax=Punica granatum TaxID=22663 RepID=A0A6P8DBI7_PUNGR|nr:purine permease 3-like [Punica granatum]OWM79995.1 hypothetical protein CDL15_Pgr006299 [Punica granatum]PKI47345.1 hypothetical protein CRG98_032270 [Punica granatum]
MAGDGAISKTNLKRILLVLNCLILCIGTTGGPLIIRLYYIHGGKRVWLASWLETAAFPVFFIPLAISYIRRRQSWATTTSDGRSGSPAPRPFRMKPILFIAAVLVGILSGVDNYLYSYGGARLPVSTSSLIIASQLGFTAFFAFLLVKLRLTPYSINSVVLLTLGAAVLALHAGGDRPEGESNRQYILGFVMMVLAAALYGFILPLVELSYNKAKQVMTYSLVMEYQLVMCISATIFCTVGMLINKDFQAIRREAKEFELGEFKYYLVLVWSGILWQCFFLGTIGVIFCASSLTSGIIVSVMLPVTEVLSVIFFKEKFNAEKGVSLFLSLWGFTSYFYGEIKQNKKKNQNQNQNHETEMNGHIIP